MNTIRERTEANTQCSNSTSLLRGMIMQFLNKLQAVNSVFLEEIPYTEDLNMYTINLFQELKLSHEVLKIADV